MIREGLPKITGNNRELPGSLRTMSWVAGNRQADSQLGQAADVSLNAEGGEVFGKKLTHCSNCWLATSRFQGDFAKSVLFCTVVLVGKSVKANT